MLQAPLHVANKHSKSKGAFSVFADPVTPPATRSVSTTAVSSHANQALQPRRDVNTRHARCNILQEVSNVNKKFTLSPGSVVGAEKENFDPVRKEIVFYRRSTASKGQPLKEKSMVVECNKDAARHLSRTHGSLLSVATIAGSDTVKFDSGTSGLSKRQTPASPTSRIMTSRGALAATSSTAHNTSSASRTQSQRTVDGEQRVRLGGRPGRSLSAAVMPDRQHQPMPSRNTSRGVADKAGVGDLVELLVCMDVTATGLKTSSRVAQLQGMRQKPQALAGKSSMPQRSVSCSGGPELRLSVPPPVPPAARQSTKLERASLASVSALSRRHPVPHPDRATTSSSKQSQVLLSALRTPPELRRGIR